MTLTPFWHVVSAIVRRDLTIERRTRQSLLTMLMFAATTVVMFNFALDAQLDAARNVAAGLLWMAILLAGTLGLNRSFALEVENRPIDALLLAPVSRSAIYVGKFLSVLLITLAFEAALVILFTVLFNRPFWHPGALLALLLGTVGYVAAGVLIAAITVQTRNSYVLIPILLLPLSLPVVLSAANITAAFIEITPPPLSELSVPLLIVMIYDVIMLTVGVLFYNYVVDE